MFGEFRATKLAMPNSDSPTRAWDTQRTTVHTSSFVHAAIEDEYPLDNLGESGLDNLSTCHLAGPEGPETLQSMHFQAVLCAAKCVQTGKHLILHYLLVAGHIGHHFGLCCHWCQPSQCLSGVC